MNSYVRFSFALGCGILIGYILILLSNALVAGLANALLRRLFG